MRSVLNAILFCLVMSYGFSSLSQTQEQAPEQLLEQLPEPTPEEVCENAKDSFVKYLNETVEPMIKAQNKTKGSVEKYLKHHIESLEDFNEFKEQVHDELVSLSLPDAHDTQDQLEQGVEEIELKRGVFSLMSEQLKGINKCIFLLKQRLNPPVQVDLEITQ